MPTKRDAASFDGMRSVAAPKAGRYWNDGTAESTPSSGSSGNWLLNSRFDASEYSLMLFQYRHRAKPPAKNGNNGLRTFWFGGFLFACLPGERTNCSVCSYRAARELLGHAGIIQNSGPRGDFERVKLS